MKLWDYHTHNKRCKHAVGSVKDYVRAAIKKGLSEIGCSDHFPMDYLPEEADVWKYAMAMNEFPEYIEEVKEAKKKYEDSIIVRVASEVDYYPDAFESYKKALEEFLPDMDYIIGSIHVIKIDGHAWAIDNDDNPAGMKEFGIDNVYHHYYSQLIELVKTGFYDIVGHCDLPKKYGIRPVDREAVFEHQLRFLDVLADSDMVMEINVSGLYKPVHEQYPELRIIKEAVDRGIPICLGSDSHKPEHVGYEFDMVLAMLKKVGVKSLVKFNKHEIDSVTID